MMPALHSLPFRFDAAKHEYLDLSTGEEYPHITDMLESTGWTDHTWCTAESRIRGTAVHKLTADHDLGALDVPTCRSRYRGWLLAHVGAMNILQPEIVAVEEPLVHPTYRYGGRPDRVWRYDGAICIGEVKTGTYEKGHPIQTALQAILISVKYRIPAPAIGRFGLYLKESGRFKVEPFDDRRDIDEALRIIKRCS